MKQRPHTSHSLRMTCVAPTKAEVLAGGDAGERISVSNSLSAPTRCDLQMTSADLVCGSESSSAAAAYRRADSASPGIDPSQLAVGDHGAAQSPLRSSSTATYTVNSNRSFAERVQPRARASTGPWRQFNWLRFLGLTLITVSGLTVLFGAATFVGWLWSAWNPA